ncbi:hypothetical protein AHAS_Ahas18G0203800 [Arachis hypogaea]
MTERGCRSAASVYPACCSRYCSGLSMDYQRYVSYKYLKSVDRFNDLVVSVCHSWSYPLLRIILYLR